MPGHNANKKKFSYRRVFRVVFVIFFLYLTGDAFYRWDGFRYHASFSEFLPALALTAILWSIVAALTAALAWLALGALEWLCRRMKCKLTIEHLMVFTGIFVLAGATVWAGRRIWRVADVYRELAFLAVLFTSVLLTWLLRNRAARWIDVVQNRITPLVWLFGICVALSVPFVAYHTWVKQPQNVISPKTFPSSVENKNRPNIILVIFDAMSARDMSLYGYQRPTTPFMEKWAGTATLFTRIASESHYTKPTMTSFMTGKRLWTHRIYCIEGAAPETIESLPAVLKNNGYYNMAFIVNPPATVKSLGIAGSFDIAPQPSEFSTPVSVYGWLDKLLTQLFSEKILLHDWILKGDFIMRRFVDVISRNYSKTLVPPENAFDKFLWIIDGNDGRFPEPFFAWIHLLPPHGYYLPPDPFMGMFDASPELRSLKSQYEAFNRQPMPYTPAMQSGVEIMRARYDEFIRYVDSQFEDFIANLAARDRLKNTLIILTTDHGESFQHNWIFHGGTLYEPETHIPLVIKEPAQAEGRVVDDLSEQIDIPVTILDLVGIPVPSWMEGRSLVPLMRGESLPAKPAFSLALEKNFSRGRRPITKGIIAVRDGDYKLIHYIEEKKSELFNLKHDPGELNDLFAKEPETGRRLLNLILERLQKANEP